MVSGDDYGLLFGCGLEGGLAVPPKSISLAQLNGTQTSLHFTSGHSFPPSPDQPTNHHHQPSHTTNNQTHKSETNSFLSLAPLLYLYESTRRTDYAGSGGGVQPRHCLALHRRYLRCRRCQLACWAAVAWCLRFLSYWPWGGKPSYRRRIRRPAENGTISSIHGGRVDWTAGLVPE